MRGQDAAAGLEELDLAARVPHDVVASELVGHENEEVRIGIADIDPPNAVFT